MSIVEHFIKMSSYIFAFLWGIFILLSLIGWGTLVNRLLFPKNQTGLGLKAAWGMAFSICIGGILNLTSTISQTTILIYLGSGFLSCLIYFFTEKEVFINFLRKIFHDCQKDKGFLAVFVITLLLIAIQYAGWVYSHRFHPDDLTSYFVFPNQMLQIGSLEADPFNTRRLVTSLGGQAFLQTFILCILDEKNLNLIDPGIALIITILLIMEHCHDKNLNKNSTIFLLFIFLLIPFPRTNTSSSLTATALFLSLFMTLEWNGLKSNNVKTANACIIALITAAIFSLKHSFIPVGGLIFILSYIFYILNTKDKNRLSAIYEFLIASLFLFLFLVPWMISMHQSSGTFLFPVFGKGYHSNVNYAYEKFTLSIAIKIILEKLKSIDFIALIILGLISLKSRMKIASNREPLLSFFLAASLGTLIIIITNGGFDTTRYPFPFVYPALIILTINVFTKLDTGTNKFISVNSIPTAMVLVGMLIGGDTAQSFYKRNNIDKIKIGLGNNLPLVSNQETDQYLKMQGSVPQSEILLARVDKPFLLDFQRNKIFVIDIPGESSPPPGIPLYKGSEPLAKYLLSQSIRYVAYSYKSELGMTKKDVEYRLKNWNFSRWVTIQSKETLDFQKNLKELGNSRKRIYDDGDVFVLDLLSNQTF